MNPALERKIVSILNESNDLTIATVREDAYPQARERCHRCARVL